MANQTKSRTHSLKQPERQAVVVAAGRSGHSWPSAPGVFAATKHKYESLLGHWRSEASLKRMNKTKGWEK